MRLLIIVLVVLGAGGLIWLLVPWPPSPPEVAQVGDAKRGEYVLRLGGCVACHTDAKNGGQFLAGGRALATAFGTFDPPDITPYPESGIGGWSTGAFVQAMTEGRSPDGHPLYPAFPYTSYTRMTRQTWSTSRPISYCPADRQRRAGPRPAVPVLLSPAAQGPAAAVFHPGAFQPDRSRSESWHRGAYIVNGPGHCGECHTPRNALGAPERDRFLAGTRDGPDGKAVPNITPNPDNGIGGWSKTDITFALQTGILPDGDVLGGAMAEVIEDATSHLTPDDRSAIAEYLLSLPPLEGTPRTAKPAASSQ